MIAGKGTSTPVSPHRWTDLDQPTPSGNFSVKGYQILSQYIFSHPERCNGLSNHIRDCSVPSVITDTYAVSNAGHFGKMRSPSDKKILATLS
jgi:hypothetical protein